MKNEKQTSRATGEGAKRPYVRPELRTIELSLDETLAEGCKLGTDPVCLANFEAGS